jgi:murein L,D-transpeptidase YcbB/YkuD
MVQIVRNGAVVHQARVIVGKPDSPTPVFSNEMQYAIVNPSWYVPPSILKNEFLPRLARDPNYAARQGYVVVRNGNSISIRQPPGERNALGHIKFMFPNDHAVYLHDTPSRALFGNEKRAFSHGCVRTDDAIGYAATLLEGVMTRERVDEIVASGVTTTVNLSKPLPVYVAYFTATANPAGGVEMHPDIYDRDGRIAVATRGRTGSQTECALT